jgi:hypothetical protein
MSSIPEPIEAWRDKQMFSQVAMEVQSRSYG